MKQTILMFLLGLSSLIGKANTWTDTGNYDVSWYDDLSTTFHITTEKELAGLAYLCNNGISFSNKTINLQADIDLTNNEWAPITTFDGTLNGNFHTVSNLHIDYKDNLFGITKGFILHNSGKIENLGLQGSVLLVSGGYGAISAGGLCVENYGTIANCTIDCEVKAYSEDNSGPSNGYLHNAGGICVINNGKIINCTNKGDISALPSVWDYRARVNCAGGIAGQNRKEIINCINYGDIATTVGYSSSSWQIGWGLPFGYSGGISGINSGTLNNVVNLGNITATVRKLASKEGTNAYSGGIAACDSGTIANAYYSSANTIEGPNILNRGIMLNAAQVSNSSYNFTETLNNNVLSLSDTDINYWGNAPSVNGNIPFLLDDFTIKGEVKEISQNTAVFQATPADLSSSAILQKGFEYKGEDESTYKRSSAAEDFTATITNLGLSTTYTMRPFIVTVGGNTQYFSEINFSTSSLSAQTLDATDITATSATLNGLAESGLATIQSQGFLWRSENETDYHIAYTQGRNFQYKVENLQPSTVYYFQAFILTTEGENVYGETLNFSTQPLTLTLSPGEIASNSSTIFLKGGLNIPITTEVTIEYKQTTEQNFVSIKAATDPNGQFECSISDLAPNTEYDCRAYIIYNNAYIYSPTYTYKTAQVKIHTLDPLLSSTVLFRGEFAEEGNFSGTVGFEYRDANHPDLIPSDYILSELNGTYFEARTSNVTNGNEYRYRAYYEDKSGTRNYGEWVYFTPTDVTTALDEITSNNKEIRVYGTKGYLFIENIPDNESIRIYSENGSLVTSQKATGNTIEITLPEGHAYIIKCASQSAKIAL